MALKVVVSRAGSTEPVSEHIFGKEARARGISAGSGSETDVALHTLPAKPARIETQQAGSYYVDVGSKVGYTADGVVNRSGTSFQVTEGTRVGLGEYTLTFKRGETPRREAVVPVAAAGVADS